MIPSSRHFNKFLTKLKDGITPGSVYDTLKKFIRLRNNVNNSIHVNIIFLYVLNSSSPHYQIMMPIIRKVGITIILKVKIENLKSDGYKVSVLEL